MPVIRIKRRASGGTVGAPTALATTEPAYSEVDDILYLGFGDSGGGVATSIKAVAGAGAFVALTGAQTVSGAKTFSGTLNAVTQTSTDSSTLVSTTAFVKAQNYLAGNQSISVSGDATGSGTTAIALTLAASGVSPAAYAKVTVNAKGLVTSGAALAAADIPVLTAVKISDFATTVNATTLNTFAAPTAIVPMGGFRMTSMADPINPQDSATKAYVDGLALGLDFKNSVRASTTANIALTGLQTVDGISLAANDRVLVRAQTAGADNGIYVVASTAWVRAADADTSLKVTSGMFVLVEQGTTLGGASWVMSTTGTITLGTTSLSFTQFATATTIVGGDGLTASGSTVNVVGTTNRIAVFSDNIDISTSYVGQSSITTLGTVTTGAWSASTIAANRGGTGQAAYAVGNVLYADSTSTLSPIAIGASGTVLTSNGTVPAWSNTIDGGTF